MIDEAKLINAFEDIAAIKVNVDHIKKEMPKKAEVMANKVRSKISLWLIGILITAGLAGSLYKFI